MMSDEVMMERAGLRPEPQGVEARGSEAGEGVGRTVYIAGPMTGIEDFNRAAFARAAERLSRDGWTVYDPVEIGEMYGEQAELEADHELLALVIRAELGFVARADAIYLLDGWERSVGAKRELQVALACGIDVILERRCRCKDGGCV